MEKIDLFNAARLISDYCNDCENGEDGCLDCVMRVRRNGRLVCLCKEFGPEDWSDELAKEVNR